MSLPKPICSVSAERSQQPHNTEDHPSSDSTSQQSLDNPQGGTTAPVDAVLAAADACHVSKQPAELQSASIDNVVKRGTEGAEATAHSSTHQKPRWGQRHAPTVSWQLDVTSARDAASRQPHKPISCGTGLSNASEAAHGYNGTWQKQESHDQSWSPEVAEGKSRGRDSSPARPGPPRHRDVQSALWRLPPLPPLPEFTFMRNVGLPSPSHDSARVQSLGAATEVLTLFADKPQTSEPKPLEEKAPGSEPDTPELLREHKAGPSKPSSVQKSEAGNGDAGDARAVGGCARSGSPLIAMPGKSPEVARLQETLASLASLKLSLRSPSSSPDCNNIASSPPAGSLPAGHVCHKPGEMQQVAVSRQGPPSKSICTAEERAADASGAECGAASVACSRITDSTWIYNPAANLENGHAITSPCEGVDTHLGEPEQQRARRLGTGQCGRALDMAQKGSLPDVSTPPGASPSKERLRKVPAAAGNSPQGLQHKDCCNARCPEDAAPSQQV